MGGDDSDNYSSSDNDRQRSRRSSSSRSRSKASSVNSQKSKNQRRKSSSSSDRSAQKEIDALSTDYKNFDYELIFENDQFECLQNKYGMNLEGIMDSTGVRNIQTDKNSHNSQIKGISVNLCDDSRENKYKAVDKMNQCIYDQLKNDKNEIQTTILIPEGMVSLLIGKRGKQINQIKSDSRADVVANQPINNMVKRTIGITGKPNSVSKAIDIIYDLLGQRANIVDQQNKIPTQANFEDIIITSRFPIQYIFKSYLVGLQKQDGKKDISLLDYLEKQYGTTIIFDKKPLFYLNQDEIVMMLSGKFLGIIKVLESIFQVMRDFYENHKRKHDFMNKILIPSKFTTKLIGKEGCMISDIAKQSEGAKIKIISNKNDSKAKKECVIEITGNIDSKFKACLIIIEKIEQFKHGGPILKDSKALRENLSSQFQNSVYDQSQVNKSSLRPLDSGRSKSRSIDRFNNKNRRYSNQYGNRYNEDRYGNNRSRSRDKYEKRDYYERERERGGYDKDRYNSRYREKGYDNRERDSRDYRERDFGDREYRERDSRRFDKGSREGYRMSRSNSQRRNNEDSIQKLKIPIILTNNLIKEFQRSDCKTLKYIQEQTGCKITIEKEKRLMLNGTVEANTNAFKKIQQEFLKIGSE